MVAGEVFLRREEEIDHELDRLALGEVLPGLLVGLLRADSDEFLEDVSHLGVVHAARRQVDGGELLDDEEEQVFLGHFRDLRVEAETLHDVADVGREAVEIAVEVRRELVGIIEQAVEAAASGGLGSGSRWTLKSGGENRQVRPTTEHARTSVTPADHD